ncbi:PDZ domain-containing protein [Candidatus Poribacteria bacterium]|nr:PDZ domain-containing protein [Candidatus Poribacteria bacterium]
MALRNSWPLIIVAILTILVIVSGCGHRYEDEATGITVRDLGSDLDNRWALKGVVVETVKSGSPADGLIETGELISHVVDERKVSNSDEFEEFLEDALDEDEKAMLKVIKTLSVNSIQNLGLKGESDPEQRGLVVVSVEPDKAADKAGIKANTIINEINGETISSMEEYNDVISKALAGSNQLVLGVFRNVVASNLSEVGIKKTQDRDDAVVVVELEKDDNEEKVAYMEGIMEGDAITHVIDEMEITGIDTYKDAIDKALDADRVVFKRGEIGGIKLAAISALGEIGDKKALDHLLEALESDDKWIRRAAAEALEEMDAEKAVQLLVYHMLEKNEPDAEVRRSCARAIARMKPLEAIEPLGEALKDSSLGVRLEAGYALGRIGEPAIEVLVKALQDEDSRVRDSAVAAMGNIGGEKVRQELIGVLRDEDEVSTVKLTAIQALYKIGDAEAIAELRRIANSGTPGIRAFVKELLTEETVS